MDILLLTRCRRYNLKKKTESFLSTWQSLLLAIRMLLSIQRYKAARSALNISIFYSFHLSIILGGRGLNTKIWTEKIIWSIYPTKKLMNLIQKWRKNGKKKINQWRKNTKSTSRMARTQKNSTYICKSFFGKSIWRYHQWRFRRKNKKWTKKYIKW